MSDLSDRQFSELVDIGVRWQLAGRPAHKFDSDGQLIERCRVCARSRIQQEDDAP